MINAREEHSNIWHNANILHVIQFVNFDHRIWSSPHEQQMQYIQNDAAQQTNLNMGTQTSDQTGKPSYEITSIFSPQLNGQLKVYL